MGMINKFEKFSSKLAELTEPLRQLLSKKNSWSWGHPQDHAFAKVKLELMKPTVLGSFYVNADLKVADTLSRAPISTSVSYDLHEKADLLMQISIDLLPASSQRNDEIWKAQASDTVCSTLISYCENGWPENHSLSFQLKLYWKWQGQLSTHNKLLLYGT